MELDNAPGQRVWADQKAAWAIDALCVEQDVGLIWRQRGPLREGLEGIENVGPRPAEVMEELFVELSANPAGREWASRTWSKSLMGVGCGSMADSHHLTDTASWLILEAKTESVYTVVRRLDKGGVKTGTNRMESMAL